MKDEPSTKNLNIFLAKTGVTSKEEIIQESNCTKHYELDLPELGKSHLYIKEGVTKYPRWTKLLEGIIDKSKIGKTKTLSAALLVRTSQRFFVLTFGQGGRFLIKDNMTEPRFGLIVTLNSVSAESLRCIDKQSLDNLESHSRIQSSYETTTDQFGIDVEQDMLKAVVGSPQDNSLGSRMTGTDSLSVSVKTNITSLSFLLNCYLLKFEEDLSPKGYDWVNNISNLKNNAAIIDPLESALDKKLKNKDFTNIWLSIPEIIQWDIVVGFIFTKGKKIIHPDITMEGFLTSVEDGNISLGLLKQRKVHCADEDHNCVHRSWSVFKCLYAEIDYEDAKYVLNDGNWFRIEPNFVNKTNDSYSKVAISKLTLPIYNHKNEGDYNKFISQSMPSDYALLDDKNKVFHGGGHGQIEVCDLFTKNKNLIHVKRYGKSSVLSHLFSQGFVSGQLLQLDQEFRSKFRAKLPNPFKSLINEKNRPQNKEFTITFAVISEDPCKELHLPFFSRVNINNTNKTLQGYGYNVELLKIYVDPIFSKTKKCPPKTTKKKSVNPDNKALKRTGRGSAALTRQHWVASRLVQTLAILRKRGYTVNYSDYPRSQKYMEEPFLSSK